MPACRRLQRWCHHPCAEALTSQGPRAARQARVHIMSSVTAKRGSIASTAPEKQPRQQTPQRNGPPSWAHLVGVWVVGGVGDEHRATGIPEQWVEPASACEIKHGCPLQACSSLAARPQLWVHYAGLGSQRPKALGCAPCAGCNRVVGPSGADEGVGPDRVAIDLGVVPPGEPGILKRGLH